MAHPPAGRADEEVPLAGGDVTEGVVRVGGTVRRPLGDHSPVVHAVLRHLEAVGFEGAPRLLGLDDRGREVLTFVEGEVAGRPWPDWVGEDDRAVSVARLVRRLDDALVPLGLPPELLFGGPAPAPVPGRPWPGPAPTFFGHRDITPENTVFRQGVAHALIDFDLVGPVSRLEEVANLLQWWGGWVPQGDRDPVQRDLDARSRGRLLVDAYGLSEDLRPQLVPVAVATAERSWHRMRHRARTQGGGWARMWAEGAGGQIRRRQRWLHDHADELTAALTG